MAKKPFICANWKMYMTKMEALRWASALVARRAEFPDVDIAVAPVYTQLYLLEEALQEQGVYLTAQNVSSSSFAALTGEVAASHLQELQVSHVLIGHSERRQYFHEQNLELGKKMQRCYEAGMEPILCVGESIEQRRAGQTLEVIHKQLKESLDQLEEAPQKLLLAYEPVWAIGSGEAASVAQAHEVHVGIKEYLRSRYGLALAESSRIIYGGSVDARNAAELLADELIDGLLIGSASRNAVEFAQILAAAQAAY